MAYGPEHRRLRRLWAQLVAGGEARCARCGWPIHPDEPWHLDHADDRRSYIGPSHQRCNTSAGAMLGNRQRRQRRLSWQEQAEANARAWAAEYEAWQARVAAEAQRPAPRPSIY